MAEMMPVSEAALPQAGGAVPAAPVAAPARLFERIMRDHNQRLFRLALGLIGDASEAEDVLQDSYLRAFERLAALDSPASLGPWLASIVRHVAIDHLRARRRRGVRVICEADLPGARADRLPDLDWAAAHSPLHDAEARVERERIRRAIESAIMSLPSPFRAVFLLREVEGLTVEETAAHLGVPPATVRSRDHRARRLLRRRLGRTAVGGGAFPFLRERCDRLVARVLARLPAPS